MNVIQLKETYNTVTVLKNLSGFTWTDKNGLGIGVEDEDAFQAYIQVCLIAHLTLDLR